MSRVFKKSLYLFVCGVALSVMGLGLWESQPVEAAQCCIPPNKVCTNPGTGGKYCAEKCVCQNTVNRMACDEESKECISQECCTDDNADCSDQCSSPADCGCISVVEQKVCIDEECIEQDCCEDNGNDCSDQCVYGGCKMCEEGTVSLPNGEEEE